METVEKYAQNQQKFEKKPTKRFPSYVDAIDISPKAKTVCEMLARVYPGDVETSLTTLGVSLEPEVVEEVLKYSYGSAKCAFVFFKFVGFKQKHSASGWNLLVDMLGKNEMFDSMWDVIKSMREEGVLSLTTFVLVFRSYCEARRLNDAVMTFDMMGKYGVEPDVVAVNELLSAMCREEGQSVKAFEFFERVKTKIALDGNSYAILLDVCEKEGNVAKAKLMFGELVIRVGWLPTNMVAYDAFLSTLIKSSETDEALKFLQVLKGKNCFPGLKFFSNALDILIKQNDSAYVLSLWDTMVVGGVTPNVIMYNAMIGLLCKNNDIASAFQLLDAMPYAGEFADPLTYNIIFQCLIKNKKVKEAGKFFLEMIKNEQPPTPANCADAISMFFDCEDPEMAYEIWFYMKKVSVTPLEDGANALIIGLASMGRLSEMRRNAERFMTGKIKIYESTMSKLKLECFREGRKGREIYEDLHKKWKSS
uniref:pentatricopeptide repeat-containing protein At1g71060, mitochondrial-like n=1 Tax=Erigeron canadensis TaxID=72917 RepID=UPI001CB90FBD|nr:pentatricopeptide repeat-containing protein At1g71060, mitochondrial-like [Erigeron canadensis]